jgi:hypothetical protein
MQAAFSAECKEACPGSEDLIKIMMGGRRLDGHEEEEEVDPAELQKYCPHIGAMKCMADNRNVCDDEPDKEMSQDDIDGRAFLECFCACPDLLDAADPKKMCPKKDTLVSCMTGASACSKTVKDMGGARVADITCEIIDEKCDEKGDALVACVGEDSMMKWGACDGAAGSGGTMSDDCCATLTSIVGCYTQKCIDLLLARNQLMADAGGADSADYKKEVKKNVAMGSACPGSGMPASEAEMEALAAGSSGSTGASTDNAPAHALPVLAMVLGLLAIIA